MSDLTVHECGPADSPTLLLLHGLTEAGTAWPDAVHRWQDRWHILAPDQRGHGSSPRFRPAELEHTEKVWLTDVLNLLDTLAQPPIVVGHSLGGLFALRAGAIAPDLVRGLVLEDPARPAGTPLGPEFVAHQEQFLDTFGAGTTAEKTRMRIESTWAPDEIDAWADCKPLVDRRMIREGLHLGSADWATLIPALTAPTLFVVPTDGEMGPADGEVSNPLVEIARIPGVGHCVRRDDAVAYHAVVDPFLDAHR